METLSEEIGARRPDSNFALVGAAFDDFRQTGIWATKKPRTQEDWERGWKYIGHSFGEVAPETIVLAQIDAWYRSIVDGKGVREGWRALKIWRALWQTMIALGYCRKPDPSKAMRRETPTVRQGVWQEGEVSRLVKGAWRRGYRGQACIIAVAWDGALSLVDVRKLTFAQMASDGQKIASPRRGPEEGCFRSKEYFLHLR